jgi:hypothetical protein
MRTAGGRDEELVVWSEEAGGESRFAAHPHMTSDDVAKFVKAAEALVRQSREYRAWVSHLRCDLGMDRCTFMPRAEGATLEMHHAPLTLFEVCEVVLRHRLALGHPVTTMALADEVLAAHMDDNVGALPLLRSLHRLAHEGTLVVLPQMVHGGWDRFLRDYPMGVSEELLARVAAWAALRPEDAAAGAAAVSPGAPLAVEGAREPGPDERRMMLMGPPGGRR